MSVSTPNMHAEKRPDLDVAVRRRFMQIGVLVLIQALALFLASGRLDWLAAWAYLAVYVAFIGINAAILLPHGKELIAERSEIKKDVKWWDKLILALTAVLGPAMLVVAGLDERLHLSPYVQFELRIAALFVIALGYGLFSWAMASNLYFSGTVRLQRDRGHTVATDGPYRYVRHPAYSGMISLTLATPVLLGSLWAFVPALLMCVTFVIRTWLEDTTLQKELAGYAEYAQRVRSRLLPGAW